MKRFGSVIVALLVAILLAITNPTINDFHDYLKVQIGQSLNRTGSQDALSSAMNTFATWAATEYGTQTAQRKDYVLFSIFTANLDGRKDQRWIGIGKQFVALP